MSNYLENDICVCMGRNNINIFVKYKYLSRINYINNIINSSDYKNAVRLRTNDLLNTQDADAFEILLNTGSDSCIKYGNVFTEPNINIIEKILLWIKYLKIDEHNPLFELFINSVASMKITNINNIGKINEMFMFVKRPDFKTKLSIMMSNNTFAITNNEIKNCAGVLKGIPKAVPKVVPKSSSKIFAVIGIAVFSVFMLNKLLQ